MADQSIVDKVKQYVLLLRKNGVDVAKTYLYGSFVTGKMHKDSDIDVLIVSKQFDEENDQLAGKAWRLVSQIDSRIEPFVIGLNRFMTDDISPLLHSIRNEGEEIIV